MNTASQRNSARGAPFEQVCMRSRAATFSVGLALVLGAGSFANPVGARWGGAQILDHSVYRAAGNARGEEAFTWEYGTNERVMVGYTASFVLAQLRRADGSLTRPQTLTRTHAIVANAGEIGLDGRGAATVLWSETVPGSIRLMASIRPRGGRFGRGSEIGRIRLKRAFDHALSVAPDGSAAVAWIEGGRIHAAQRPPGRCASTAPRACFGAPQDFPGGRCPSGIEDCLENFDVVVSAGRGGHVFAAYTAVKRTSSGFRTFVRLVVARPGHRFGKPVAISGAEDIAIGPRIARVHDGGAIVTWIAGGPLRAQRVVGLLVGPNGKPRSRPFVLSAAGCVGALVRVDARDDLTATWNCYRGADQDQISLVAAGGPAAGPLNPSIDLGRQDYDSNDDLAFDARANAVLVYSPDGKTTATRVRPPGGTFGPPLAVPALTGRRRPTQHGGRLIEAGPRLTLLQYGNGQTSQLRDWTP